MSCTSPLKGYRTPGGVVFSQLARHDIIGDIELPCGQCRSCRLQRAADWEVRCVHEASLWKQNCFITLTYGRDQMPKYGSLDHRDFQLFMKRLRKFAKTPIRFYMSGEYGPLNSRPHYHACIFNFTFTDTVPAGKSGAGEVFFNSPTLDKLWGLGRCSVQPMTRQTAGYCARYIMEKQLGQAGLEALKVVDPDTGEIVQKRPEYSCMSLRPGIGAAWLDRYVGDVYPRDYVVIDGEKRRPPKFYDRRLKKRADVGPVRGVACGQHLDEIEQKRQQLAAAAAPDNTDERRRVRAQVTEARIRNLKRYL